MNLMGGTQAWAETTFGRVQLGDRRRTKRLVQVAASKAASPQRSLNQVLGPWAGVKGGYRLLHQEKATIDALTAPHRAATITVAGATPGVVLLIQDMSEIDYSPHRKTTGLGPIGNGRGRGFLLQSMLAVRPSVESAQAEILGLVHLEAFDRVPRSSRTEGTYARRKRVRESDQ